MQHITTLLFDLDNTLVDRQRAARLLMHKIVDDDFSMVKPHEEIEAIVDLMMEWDDEGSTPKDIVFSRYLLAYPQTEKTWQEYNRKWWTNLGEYTTPYPRAIEVLATLKKKYKLGIITNGNAISQRIKIAKLGCEPYMDVILISGEEGIHKPDPRIFQKALDLLHSTASETAFIGDSLRFDMEGAIAMGMLPIWIYPDLTKTTDLPITRIHRIEDLLAIF
jgi:putative hydrolase of the HAD superfamily